MATSRGSVPVAAVIIPCFNDGETVREAVDSVKAEPLGVELVVIDDGSTDPPTLALLESLRCEGVNVIHQPNQGPSVATMAGFRATSAEYVMRLDADDLVEPGAIADLARALDDEPAAAVAWGDAQTFGMTTFRIPGAPKLDAWLLTYTNCIPGTGCLTRRSAVIDAGGWQLRDGWEDWDLWLALAERGWVGVYVPRVALRYRRDAGGRHMDSLGESTAHYKTLRDRHQDLFASRASHRKRSEAPLLVKLSVAIIEAIPGIPRLARIQLCELVTHLFWNGGLRATAIMLRQAVAWRLALRNRSPIS